MYRPKNQLAEACQLSQNSQRGADNAVLSFSIKQLERGRQAGQELLGRSVSL